MEVSDPKDILPTMALGPNIIILGCLDPLGQGRKNYQHHSEEDLTSMLHTYVYTDKYTYVCMFICTYMSVYIHIYVYTHLSMCVYSFMYMCIYPIHLPWVYQNYGQ